MDTRIELSVIMTSRTNRDEAPYMKIKQFFNLIPVRNLFPVCACMHLATLGWSPTHAQTQKYTLACKCIGHGILSDLRLRLNISKD